MLNFTDEQRMIQEMVRKLAWEKIEPLVKEADLSGHSSPEIIRILAENGLLKIELPEKYGGIGANYTTIAMVVEELAKVDASAAQTRAILKGSHYAKQRVQFGVPLANLQAIRFMLADMSIQIEAARALLYRTNHLNGCRDV